MNEPISRSLVVVGASLLLGFIALGWLLGNYAVRVKKFDRTVVVKGLSEREVPADVAIWPLTFQEASNDLNALFGSVQRKNAVITEQRRGPDSGGLGLAGTEVSWDGRSGFSINGFLIPLGLAWFAEAMLQRRQTSPAGVRCRGEGTERRQ